jgi:hypothetical protein
LTEARIRLAGGIAALLVTGFVSAADTGVAVLPPINRSGQEAPQEWIAESLQAALARRGLRVLATEELDEFLARHRIRYTGGITEEHAVALGTELGLAGAVSVSIDDWEVNDPPRVALTARYVGAAAGAPLLWCHGVAAHGWERPRAFEVGIVTDVEVLLERAVETLAASLAAAAAPARPETERRFQPSSLAVDPGWAAANHSVARPRIAVLPFVTQGVRREVGEVVALQFVKHLLAASHGTVVEPGVVRNALLEARVIQDGGPSLSQVDALRALLDVDLVVSGSVSDFELSGSAPRTPFVVFTARAIDAASRQVVWSSVSHARGDDGLRLFGSGHVRSGIELASRLVEGVVANVSKEIERARVSAKSERRKEPTP